MGACASTGGSATSSTCCSRWARWRRRSCPSARTLELLGQPGEVLAEGDLVADLLVGQLDLAVAHRRQRLRVDPVGRLSVEGIDVVAELGELVGQLGRDGRDAVVERGELVVQGLGRA